MLFLFPLALAAEPCSAPTSALTMERLSLKIDTAFADIDSVAVQEASTALLQNLSCLKEPISPSLAARIHRSRALTAMDANNRAAAELAFASARALEPSWTLPESIRTQTVEEIYLARDPAAGRVQPLPTPTTGQILIDGTTGTERPLERPVIFQRLDDQGAVLETLYLLPGEPTPTYESIDEVKTQKRRVALLVGAGSAGVAAAALYGAAYGVRTGPYEEAVTGWETLGSESDRTQVEQLYQLNHGLIYSAAALGVLALGGASLTLVW